MEAPNPIKLTPEQQRCIDIIKQHGCIVRYDGGFWAKPNDEMQGLFPTGMSGINPEEFKYPENNVGTNTIKALEKKGIIKPTEVKNSKYGTFAVEYKLVAP